MKTVKPLFAVKDVVPHAAPMILIDEIEDYSDNGLIARVTIRDSSLFLTGENVVPAWVGIEYMAQAIAAWSGIQARLRNKTVRIGYLLGSRHYQASEPSFLIGETLKVAITKRYHEDELGAFDCEISNNRISVVATLNVYQPKTEEPLN